MEIKRFRSNSRNRSGLRCGYVRAAVGRGGAIAVATGVAQKHLVSKRTGTSVRSRKTFEESTQDSRREYVFLTMGVRLLEI